MKWVHHSFICHVWSGAQGLWYYNHQVTFFVRVVTEMFQPHNYLRLVYTSHICFTWRVQKYTWSHWFANAKMVNISLSVGWLEHVEKFKFTKMLFMIFDNSIVKIQPPLIKYFLKWSNFFRKSVNYTPSRLPYVCCTEAWLIGNVCSKNYFFKTTFYIL